MWIRLLLVTFAIAQASVIQKPRPGRSFNIFQSYGHFLNLVRVVPRDVQTFWAFKQPTDLIFKDYSIRDLSPYNNSYIYICNNMSQLVDVYFKKFSVEGLKVPHHTYTAGWTYRSQSKYFGIEKEYTGNQYWYALVRIDKTVDHKEFDDDYDFVINDDAMSEIKKMVYNKDTKSCRDFIPLHGSHYIKSYATGDSLYQVFVYGAEARAALWNKMLDFNNMSEEEQKDALSPKYAVHIGQIQSASGERSVKEWATREATVTRNGRSYPCLGHFKFDREKLNEAYSHLEDKILLELKLDHLGNTFPTDENRVVFNGVVVRSFQPSAEEFDTYSDDENSPDYVYTKWK